MGKITTESINAILAPDGWSLISQEYKNLDSELVFECDEGHRVYSTWKKIRTKRECPVCKNNTYKEQEIKVVPKKKDEFRVLAIDQATRKSGWSIFSNDELLYYGSFETQLEDEIARDCTVRAWLINMVEKWKPDIVGLEGIQYEQHQGVVTFQTLARLQGILMATLYELRVPYVICPTNTWRAHCKVRGQKRADKKRSMQLIAKEWYDITVNDDCADAIGIGRYVKDTNKKNPQVISWE